MTIEVRVPTGDIELKHGNLSRLVKHGVGGGVEMELYELDYEQGVQMVELTRARRLELALLYLYDPKLESWIGLVGMGKTEKKARKQLREGRGPGG